MKPWTPADIELLREHYPDKTASEVADLLGREVSTVHQAAGRYGIKKSDAFYARQTSGRIQRANANPRIKATQFKPGQIPWNAGMKGWSPPGCERTQFKPGTRMGAANNNWVPVGSYRITTADKILQQKTSERPGPASYRWTPVARLVWEAEHGPIPAGAMVVFKRGMKTSVLEEITLDKLDCISRAENARRNHPRNRDPELGRLIQLKGAINRQVNRINREHQQTGVTP